MSPQHSLAGVAALLLLSTSAGAQRRVLQPEDLFRIERIGAITWSPSGDRAAVEISRPNRWLDGSIPSARIAVVDATSGSLRVLSHPSSRFVGFFRAAWSPNGRRLVFLGVDSNAVVRPWLWTVGHDAPVLLRGLQLRDALGDRPTPSWIDDHHVLLLLRDTTVANSGPLYASIVRGRNVADAWTQARVAKRPSVTVFDSRGHNTVTVESRIVSVDVRTNAMTTLARGAVHAPRLSADRRVITYWREDPTFLTAKVASFFGPEAQGEGVYDRVNLGGTAHHIDARTGAEVPTPDTARAAAHRPGAGLRVVNEPTIGSRLVLSRPGVGETVVWRGNEWLRDVDLGRVDSIRYSAADGTRLTGWILYPPGYTPGRTIPIVTRVYPGAVFGARPPRDFDIFSEHFEHPQQIAALGYGVVAPSMPESDRPMMGRALESLGVGVFPLLDTLIARGIADSTRIALLGQSAGGYATLGLITQTRRFRTAIASASYCNLVSLYGTFYGQYRYGDSGHPQRAAVLRMLQFERGYYGAGAPPWEAPERYRMNSPIDYVAKVETPLMLVHGDQDFIPIQQAEEFFSALYRRDKRVTLVRYAGEGHTIGARENVLDMWRRITDWLRDTMPAAAN